MTAIATPVFAQAAIQEPGAFAFYHPNADVLAGRKRYRPADQANAYYNSTPCPHVIALSRDQPTRIIVTAGRDSGCPSAGCGAPVTLSLSSRCRIALSNFSPKSASSSLARSLTAQ